MIRRLRSEPGPWQQRLEQPGHRHPQPELKPDRQLTFDKLTNVHFSGTRHEEDQPSHLLVHTEVCHTICGKEYGHPCIRFCPANVYEIVPGAEGPRLQINGSNCPAKDCTSLTPTSDYVGSARGGATALWGMN